MLLGQKELCPRRLFDEFEKAWTPEVAIRPPRDAHTRTASPLRARLSGGADGPAPALSVNRALLRSFHGVAVDDAHAPMTADAALMPGSPEASFGTTALKELTAALEHALEELGVYPAPLEERSSSVSYLFGL